MSPLNYNFQITERMVWVAAAIVLALLLGWMAVYEYSNNTKTYYVIAFVQLKNGANTLVDLQIVSSCHFKGIECIESAKKEVQKISPEISGVVLLNYTKI